MKNITATSTFLQPTTITNKTTLSRRSKYAFLLSPSLPPLPPPPPTPLLSFLVIRSDSWSLLQNESVARSGTPRIYPILMWVAMAFNKLLQLCSSCASPLVTGSGMWWWWLWVGGGGVTKIKKGDNPVLNKRSDCWIEKAWLKQRCTKWTHLRPFSRSRALQPLCECTAVDYQGTKPVRGCCLGGFFAPSCL